MKILAVFNVFKYIYVVADDFAKIINDVMVKEEMYPRQMSYVVLLTH